MLLKILRIQCSICLLSCAFKDVIKKIYDAKLVVIGDGLMRERWRIWLQNLAWIRV
jgi:hypothetical protein